MTLNDEQESLCASNRTDCSEAVLFDTTLEREPSQSHTKLLLDVVAEIIQRHGNDRGAWKAGCRFDFENPEHRL